MTTILCLQKYKGKIKIMQSRKVPSNFQDQLLVLNISFEKSRIQEKIHFDINTAILIKIFLNVW